MAQIVVAHPVFSREAETYGKQALPGLTEVTDSVRSVFRRKFSADAKADARVIFSRARFPNTRAWWRRLLPLATFS
jgi:hypothetical protein